MSSLCRGHANLLCIVPIFSYASPKGAIVVRQIWSGQLEILILYGPRVCRYRAMPRDGGAVPRWRRVNNQQRQKQPHVTFSDPPTTLCHTQPETLCILTCRRPIHSSELRDKVIVSCTLERPGFLLQCRITIVAHMLDQSCTPYSGFIFLDVPVCHSTLSLAGRYTVPCALVQNQTPKEYAER